MVKINKKEVKKVDLSTDKLWNDLLGFASYVFNKSHSIAYSIIAYQTMRAYHYRYQEFLELQLNEAKEDSFDAAMKHLKNSGYKIVFPDYTNMDGEDYKIYSNTKRRYLDGTTRIPERGFVETKDYEFEGSGSIKEVLVPGKALRHYDHLKDALFDPDLSGAYILKGVFTKLINDRNGLSDLLTKIPTRNKRLMLEDDNIPDDITFDELLDEMKIANVITEYEGNKREGYKIMVVPYRGEPKEVYIRGEYDPHVTIDNNKYDKKYFHDVRPGVLSEKPSEMEDRSVMWEHFIQRLDHLKQRVSDYYGKDWMNDKTLKYKYLDKAKDELQDMLHQPMYKDQPDYDPKDTDELTVIFKSVKSYGRNAKITFQFANGEDFYYINSDQYNKLKNVPKDTLMELVLKFSPFIQYRTGNYIEDYDVVSIKNLDTGETI